MPLKVSHLKWSVYYFPIPYYLCDRNLLTSMRIYCFFIWLILGFSAKAITPKQLFEQANTAAQKADYPKAIQGYLQLISQGNATAEVHFNLANTYITTQKLGKAILHYELATQLKPSDKAIWRNLAAAQDRITDRIENKTTFGIISAIRWLRDLFSPDIWSAIFLLSWWSGIAGILLWLLGPKRDLRKKGFIIGFPLTFLALIWLAFTYSSHSNMYSSNAAIVTQKVTTLRSAPDAAGSDILPLNEGNKVYILNTLGQWVQVSLQNGEQGWLQTAAIERL